SPCPAGHLPLKGGDWRFQRRRAPSQRSKLAKAAERINSPLEGEMAGRPEGGAVPPAFQQITASHSEIRHSPASSHPALAASVRRLPCAVA
ncbi:MAG: hypothetical protein E5V45_29045, partial [Mesorhizobium sp.]